MRDRFGLDPGGEGRPGVDAYLPARNGQKVPFEVKSSDTSSVSTARDVGREHIEKWRRRHWLFGFYARGSRNPPVAKRYIYASPAQLEPWIAEQEQYVLLDWELVRLLPTSADTALLSAVVGEKDHYTLEDAQRLLKQQKLEAGEHMIPELRSVLDDAGIEPGKMTTTVYRQLMDLRAGFSRAGLERVIEMLALPEQAAARAAFRNEDFYAVDEVIKHLSKRKLSNGKRLTNTMIKTEADEAEGYSTSRMLVLLHERVRYLLDRGATRNNPHIPERRLLALVPDDQVMAPEAPQKAHRLEELVLRAFS